MDKTEKIAYLKALIFIATADDTVDQSELEQFSQLGSLYGLTEDEVSQIADSVIKKEESVDAVLSAITERPTKLLLLYDLLAICYADNCYSLAEKNTMRTITNTLGIEIDKLIAMENAMQESVALNEKINTILEK